MPRPQSMLMTAAALGLLAASSTTAENNGTVKGNKCCYDNHTGKYCGKPVNDAGTTVGTGSPCECGNFMTAPGVGFTGVKFKLDAPAISVSLMLPEIGDPEMELSLTLGALTTLTLQVVPGQLFSFSGIPFDTIHVTGIDEALQIDPSNPNAFPVTITVNGGPFAGSVEPTFVATPGDLDIDGTVDGVDLGIMLAAWGSPSSEADLDGDGVVSAADLGLLLANWG